MSCAIIRISLAVTAAHWHVNVAAGLFTALANTDRGLVILIFRMTTATTSKTL
jgi:hypothetical protein